MTQNHKEKCKGVTLKSLETRLRNLAEVEVPETLRAKLFATIPDSQAKVTPEYRVRWRLGAWVFGAAAAAVLILALVVTQNYNPSMPSQALITDPKDISLCYVPADRNNARYGLQQLTISQNEPGYKSTTPGAYP